MYDDYNNNIRVSSVTTTILPLRVFRMNFVDFKGFRMQMY